eukprot:349682-Chlamydomonas_euryale.AAC.3
MNSARLRLGKSERPRTQSRRKPADRLAPPRVCLRKDRGRACTRARVCAIPVETARRRSRAHSLNPKLALAAVGRRLCTPNSAISARWCALAPLLAERSRHPCLRKRRCKRERGRGITRTACRAQGQRAGARPAPAAARTLAATFAVAAATPASSSARVRTARVPSARDLSPCSSTPFKLPSFFRALPHSFGAPALPGTPRDYFDGQRAATVAAAQLHEGSCSRDACALQCHLRPKCHPPARPVSTSIDGWSRQASP